MFDIEKSLLYNKTPIITNIESSIANKRLVKPLLLVIFLFGGAYFMSISEKTPMTVEKAAEYTGFSKAYIYKLIGAGKIPSYKPDTSKQGKVILCKEELQNFLFSNRRASNEELR